MSLFFDASQLPQASPEYVAWVDVMGTKATMSHSISGAANFIFKLHIAAIQATTPNISVYPVMDGCYVTGANQRDILNFLSSVFEAVANEFNSTTDPFHRFIVRGALAFGPVVHGASVPQAASSALAQKPNHRDSILLGLPIVQAHESETKAPPFGLFVHESARSFAPAGHSPLHFVWWRWANPNTNQVWIDLSQNLPAHLVWCAEHAMSLEYPSKSIVAHTEMVDQYFR